MDPPRVKLLLSSGGTVLPRPLDGKLRYVGGETRILSVPRTVRFADLISKVRDLFCGARSIKYQQPDEDLDSLVSVVNDDDVANMMDEHDKASASDSPDRPSRLRVFAFSHPSEHGAPLFPPQFDEREIERMFVDALNRVDDGGPEHAHLPWLNIPNLDRLEHSSSSSPSPNRGLGEFPRSYECGYGGDAFWIPAGGECAGFPGNLGYAHGHGGYGGSAFRESCPVGFPRSYGSPHRYVEQFGVHVDCQLNPCVECVRVRDGHLDSRFSMDGNGMGHCYAYGSGCCRHPFSPVSVGCENYSPVRLGHELGNEAFYHPGQLSGFGDSSMRCGNEDLGYGMGSLCHGPCGSGSAHNRLGEYMQESMQSELVYGRSPPILQSNLSVSFNYNQSVQVGGPRFVRFEVDEQIPVHQARFNNIVPVHMDWVGFVNQQVHDAEFDISHRVNLEGLQSSSLASPHYQQNIYSPPLVHLPTSPPSVVATEPVLSHPAAGQPLTHVNEINFHGGIPVHKEDGTEEEASKFRSLSENMCTILESKCSEHAAGANNFVMLGKVDVPCQDDDEEHSASELINALRKVVLEGSYEATGDTSNDLRESECHILEPMNLLENTEVCSVGVVAPMIEPTMAEAEAIEKGLQTIKNSDLEEVSALGTGAYGAVFHGKWKGCDVAIKRIKASCFSSKPSERERLIADFWKEALILSSLHHPNVLSFYGVVRDAPDGNLATVSEFMVNGSLKKFLQKKDRTIDRRKRLIIAMDVAFGMEYLHGKNIVHFDMKCENLLVNMRDPHRPICKIGDLGLSKVKQHAYVSGGVRGTLPWMAPELLSGKSNKVSEKVDVYSFGVVIWELLTGEEPYAEMNYASVIGGIVDGTLRPKIPVWCDPEWRSLMVSCWSSEPSERPSFSEISQKLRKMAAAINLA